MATHKITWPCHAWPTRRWNCSRRHGNGHTGKGKFCHRCYQAAKRAADRDRIAAERRDQKLAWAASFAADPIDLRPLHPVACMTHEAYNNLKPEKFR